MSSRGRIPTTYGDGAINATPEIASGLSARRVLLVCGERSFEASGAAQMMPALERVSAVTRWNDFSPNTSSTDVEKGLAVIRKVDPDLVLGVGGGSAMDIAKLLCAFDRVPLGQIPEAIRSGARITTRRRSLVLAPTTSGSGSQATHFAVVYIGDSKYSIAGPAMYADHIVLDPKLAVSAPPHQRATSGIDAVCQAIESLWATGATATSRRRARMALHLLLNSIQDFVQAPDAKSARAMCIGSHLAGQAIDISKTTAAHALSYALTKHYGVDHGNAVALTLGAFIDAHDSAPPHQIQSSINREQLRTIVAEVRHRLGATAEHTARCRFNALLRSLGLAVSLHEIGLRTEAELEPIVRSVNVERLANNPVRFTEADLYELLQQTMTASVCADSPPPCRPSENRAADQRDSRRRA